jgi:hypothetical protein
MAERPKNTRLINVFNPGVDKRIPLGFVDQVIDKETGNLVGFVEDGKFYKLGEKVEKKPKTKEPDTVKDLNFKIKNLEMLISRNQDELFRYDPGTADYKETAGVIKKFKEEVKGLKTRLDSAKKVETARKEVKTFKKEESNWEDDVAAAKKDLQIAKDTDGDVAAAQNALDALNKKKPKVPSTAKTPTPESGYYSGSTFVPGKQTAVTPTPTSTPTPKSGKTGETPKAGNQTPVLTDAQQREQALGVVEGADFALPETIFNNVPSLKAILDRYVKEDWTADKLRKAIRDDVWYRQNSGAIKQRYVQLFNYRDLVKTGQAQGTTQYEQDIVKLERQIADKARAMGSGIASDPAALRKAAENMYITNVGIDDAMTTDFIAAAIRPIGSMIAGQGTQGYSGQALKDYQAIQSLAKANGFSVKDIVPGGQSEQQVLQEIAKGTIDPNRLAQDARKLAAQGQPQYVRDLLGQGYNLDQIYAPYRQTMANILEINPDQVDLNDPTLRSAITDKGDMNVYDFKRTLKADKRWQYTENAKQEVSDAAFKVLRDFGFQG